MIRKIKMKKLLIGLLILIALAGGAFYYLSTKGDGLIRNAVVEYVPPIIGADVQLDNVRLDAKNGSAEFNGLVLGNPSGFNSNHLFKIDNMSLKLDIQSLTSDVIKINEVRLNAPDMIYEVGRSGNNIGKVQENVDKYIKELGFESDDSQLKYIVEHVYINATKVEVVSDLIGGKGVGITLPNLHITDIGKKENGAIASDVLKQIFAVISANATKMAQEEILNNAVGNIKDLGDNTVKKLEDDVTNKVKDKLKGILN